MARPQAVAVGLYVPTPSHLLADIARLVAVPPPTQDWNGRAQKPTIAVCDPCAGEGEAIVTIAKAIEARGAEVELWTNELEAGRHKALTARLTEYWDRQRAKHGDAFCLEFEPSPGAGLLFFNPPYNNQTTPRLETRFLDRFASAVAPGGVLLLLVPYKALDEASHILARSFTNVRCYRFPDGDFEVYRQVLLCADRSPDLLEPDPAIEAVVRTWSADPSLCQPWERVGSTVYVLPSVPYKGFSTWEIALLDLVALSASARPWERAPRQGGFEPIVGMVPAAKGLDLLTRRFPVAMPLKPAYVAAAVACGVFDGERLSPNDPASGLPDVLAKGVFSRKFVAIDEKTNKDGEKVGEIQTQTPELEITVLDLRAGSFRTLPSTDARSAARSVDEMTAANFLDAYSRDLLRVMKQNCPVLHDPQRDGDDPPLPSFKRPLFAVQANAVRAAVKLVSPRYAKARAAWDPAGAGKSQNVLGLGEVGVGKSITSLAIAAALGKRSVLVICPPHLVDRSWPNEVAAVLPDATTHTLRTVADVEEYAALRRADKANGVLTTRVAVLSREAAKLGHSYGELAAPRIPLDKSLTALARAAHTCPSCGSPLPTDDGRGYASQRMLCGRTTHIAGNTAARLAERLARILWPVLPGSPAVAQVLRSRPARLLRYVERQGRAWAEVRAQKAAVLRRIVLELLEAVLDAALHDAALIALLGAIGDRTLARLCAEELLGTDGFCGMGKEITLLLPAEDRAALAASYPDKQYARPTWAGLEESAEHLARGESAGWSLQNWTATESGIAYEKQSLGSAQLAEVALRHLIAAGSWPRSAPCQEPLYFAVGEPVRYPVADWIVKRHKRLFDFIIRDEAHEHADSDAAQTQASTKLIRLNIPAIDLTGSACGGYAESLFAGSYARDGRFRDVFARGEERAFVRQYGYVKRIVEDRDGEGRIVEFGAQSDKVVRSSRTIGNAPGVLPLFLLQWLLRGAITMHKGDLAIELPPHTERQVTIQIDGVLAKNAELLARKLREQIKRDKFEAGKAEKLWGALVELVSYPDLAVEGIGGTTDYEIRYPPEVEAGSKRRKADPDDKGELVVSVPLLPASTILPKERALLEEVEAQLSAGHRVLLFPRHTVLLPRLAALIERELGETCPVLHASKAVGMRKGERVIGAHERQAWIESEIIGKKRRILAVNPVAVKTGLNVLTWFDRAWWHENPNCDAIVDRQANGRIDRIGKRGPTEAIYALCGEVQQKAFTLLKHKVAVSLAVDGLDAGSALAMAGIGGEGGFDAFSVGRQLFELMEKDGS